MSIETTREMDGQAATTEELDLFIDVALAPAAVGIQAPRPEAFTGEDGEPCEFLERRDLTALGQRLIGAHEQFAHLLSLEVLFLWKAQGGSSGGKDVLGKAQRPSGLLKHFSEADFIVWLAADHIGTRMLSARQIEALLFHELCHCQVDPDKGTPKIVGHDWSGFASEIEHYGLYLPDMREIDQAMSQLRLPGTDR